MTKYYISKSNVDQAIEYFKNSNISNEHMFSMFLITKHLGITQRKRVTISMGQMDPTQKEDMGNTLWLLGGLLDRSEEGIKNTVLFPFNFSNEEIVENNMYQSKAV